MNSAGWIGVDLDGTLAHYDHWRGPTEIGEPIPEMVARVKRWLAEGRRVKIFTARISPVPSATMDQQHAWYNAVREAIEDWCAKHLHYVLEVTNIKDFDMIELWDDRAVRVVLNTGAVSSQQEIDG